MPPRKPPKTKRSAAPKQARPSETPARATKKRPAPARFPIVGVGASAGGLEAFRELLANLPVDTGMGFVLVQHLDPEHDSALTDLLQRATKLPVHEVTDKLRVEPDHVYVIPPNRMMGIENGALTLQPRQRDRGASRSIDLFFDALAQDQHDRAIGVVLSGTASDGTVGLEAIKAEGGITFAQDDSAKYDSMPRSAVAAGCVDFVMSPTGIARELDRIARHPAISGTQGPFSIAENERSTATAHEDDETALPSGGHGTPPTGAESARAEARREPADQVGMQRSANAFKKILVLLRNHAGVDFSLYKSNTIQRRITRRMVLSRHQTLDDYAGFLRGNAKELDALYTDVLISVTSFFRNPEAFDLLKRRVWPELLKQRGDDPIRVWVLGCSTGQEAYSLAMSFSEAADKAPRMRALQIFATDLNEVLLDKARQALYAKTVEQDVTPERLRRFFVEEEGGYRVNKALRERVVFARQNVISDPPFSRMDLISCRNLLIYLEPNLQQRVIPVFHYALKPAGFLFLGASESTGGYTELFDPIDKKQKIFLKKAAPTPTFQLPARRLDGSRPTITATGRGARPVPQRGARGGQGGGNAGLHGFGTEASAQREADRVTVNQFAPPAVLVNAELQVLQFRGATSAYLEPPAGKASFDVLKMARNGLAMPLRSAINQANKHNRTVRREGVHIAHDGNDRIINLEVIPLKNLRERHFLIVFENVDGVTTTPPTTPSARGSGRTRKHPAPKTVRADSAAQSRRVATLEAELRETRDYLQSVQEQHEAANEELQASNEEIQSANEELQSVNEELETSKEELESANEELTTVNDEMTHRNTELGRLNADLTNIQTSTRQAIVLLGRDLTIRRFSAKAERQLNLIAADIGRPFNTVRHDLGVRDFDALLAGVIDSIRSAEREVQDREGRWFSLRVQPYLTLDNKVDGAVVVLVDIDDLKRTELAIVSERDFANTIIDTVRDPLLVLDGELRVLRASRSFCAVFHMTVAETIGTLVFDLGNKEWNIPELRRMLIDALQHHDQIDDFSVTCDFESMGRRTMVLNARRLQRDDGASERILLAFEDVTNRERATRELQESEATLRSHAEDLARFNRAAVDRELRMIELKREVNGLRERLGESGPYRLEFEHPDRGRDD